VQVSTETSSNGILLRRLSCWRLDVKGLVASGITRSDSLPCALKPEGFTRFAARNKMNRGAEVNHMIKFLLWCILLFLCWPLALLALVLYPLVWILTLPFRLVGIAVEGVFELLRAVITLPARILRGPRHA
jgi:hypothetical protein